MQQHRSNGWESVKLVSKVEENINRNKGWVIDKNRDTSGNESIHQQ